MASVSNITNSIAYVEPNNVLNINSGLTTDHKDHFKAPDLEDYCIALNMEVEVVGRNFDARKNPHDKSVILMSWTDQGGKSSINFMEGKKFYRRESDRQYDEAFFKSVREGKEDIKNHKTGKIGSDYWGFSNGLSTDYTDSFYYDLKDHGTTEMFGISSVDIVYQNWMVPQVTIEFVDIRGGSLMQPTEMRNGNGFNGMNGFSEKDIASSFFQCFFTFPYPRFNIVVKGFYGQPVSYEITCNDFRVKFDASTGNFNATAKFVGYSFSFMNDVSLLACMAAPYCNNLDGSNYWDKKVEEGEFVIPNSTGQNMPMPKLSELCANYGFILQKAEEMGQNNELISQYNKKNESVNNRTQLYSAYNTFFNSLVNILDGESSVDSKYGVVMQKDGSTYKAVIVLVSEEEINNKGITDFGKLPYLKDGDNKVIFDNLTNLIAAENLVEENTGEVYSVPSQNFTNVKPVKLINKLNTPFTSSSFKSVRGLTEDEIRNAFTSKKINPFSNGYHYNYAFIFAFGDYSALQDGIDEDAQDSAEMEDAVKVEKQKILVDALGFNPSLENMSKIYMAHFETFMHLMYQTVEKIQDERRTLNDLGVSNTNIPDVSLRSKIVPPFPRITKDITENGITKREDAWIGEFGRSKKFREADLVNEIFNGVNQVAFIIANAKNAQERLAENIEQNSNANNNVLDKYNSSIHFPVSNFDFVTDGNPYGEYNDKAPVNNKREFAGRVFIRMLQILGLGLNGRSLASNYIETIAKAEAKNFSHIFLQPGNTIRKMLQSNANDQGGISADDILTIVTESNSNNSWGKQSLAKKVGNDFTPLLDIYRVSNSNFHENGGKKYSYISSLGKYTIKETIQIANSGNIPHDGNIVGNFAPVKKGEDIAYTDDNVNSAVIFFDKNVDRVNNIIQRSLSSGNAPDDYSTFVNDVDGFNVTFNPETYSEYFGSNNFGTEALVQEAVSVPYNDKNRETILVYKNTNTNPYATKYDSLQQLHKGSDYKNIGTNPEKYAITQFCGINTNSQLWKLHYSYSIFGQERFRVEKNKLAKCALVFYSLLPMYNFDKIVGDLLSKRQIIVPYSSVLQIGAILYLERTSSNWFSFNNLNQMVANNGNLKNLRNLKFMSSAMIARYIHEFVTWANKNYNKFFGCFEVTHNTNSVLYQTKNKNIYREGFNYNVDEIRLLNNETSEQMKALVSEILKPIRVIKGANVDDDGYTNKYDLGNDYQLVTEGMAKTYLNSFLKALAKEYSVIRPENDTNEADSAPSFAPSADKATDDMKISFYNYLKNLYDKWIASSHFEEWKMYKFFSDETGSDKQNDGHNFYFIDSYYNKIGNELYIDVGDMVNKLLMVTDQNNYLSSLISFMSDMFATNRCLMLSVQNFMDLSDFRNMETMFKPIPFNSMRSPKRHPDFVILYSYEPSSKINTGGSGDYEDDGFSLNPDDVIKNPQLAPIAITSRNVTEISQKNWYQIPAFGVGYGMQYQSYFNNIEISMENPMMTEQALQATFAIASAAVGDTKNGDKKIVSSGQDLFTIYSNNSYSCTVTMMGCAWVQPLMYFMLNNVPMFKGAYLIQEVSHRIEPGNFQTTFTGVRMANVQTRLNKSPLLLANNNAEIGSEFSAANRVADVDNDCEYKVYPVGVDYSDNSPLTGDETNKAIALINKVITIWNKNIGGQYGSLTVAQAAGIVGNMAIESPGFDPYKVIKDSNGYYSGGLFMLNGTALGVLINNGDAKMAFNTPNGTTYPNSGGKPVIPQNINADKQIEFVIQSLTGPYMSKSKLVAQRMTSTSNASEAASVWDIYFERSSGGARRERQKKAVAFYNAYINNGNTTQQPVQNGNNVDSNSFTSSFFNSVQKTFGDYNTKLTCGFNNNIKNNKIIFKQADGGNSHMAQLFDVILNGYHDYVSEIYWNVKDGNSFGVKPSSVGVTVSQSNSGGVIKCRIVSGLTLSNDSFSYSNYPINESLPTDFFLCLLKRYGKDAASVIRNKNFKSDWSNARPDGVLVKWFRHAELIACNTLIASGTGGNIVNGRICDWNVESAANYIKSNSLPLGEIARNGKCTQSVRAALINSGLINKSFGFGGGVYGYPWEWPDTLEKLGFVKIYEGINKATDGSLNGTHVNLQIGDISCLWSSETTKPARNTNHPDRYHVAMWDGNTWDAEGKASNVVPYASGNFIVKIYRYRGKCDNSNTNGVSTVNNFQGNSKRLLVIGDSIAAGAKNSGVYDNAEYVCEPGISIGEFAGIAQPHKYINGKRTTVNPKRYYYDLVKSKINNADTVIVYLGTNDAPNIKINNENQTIEGLKKIKELLRNKRVIWVGCVYAPNYTYNGSNAWDSTNRSKVDKLIDTYGFSTVKLSDNQWLSIKRAKDGLHPNSDGHKRLKQLIIG